VGLLTIASLLQNTLRAAKIEIYSYKKKLPF